MVTLACESRVVVNQNIEAQLNTVDQFIDAGFEPTEGQTFTLVYRPIIEDGAFRAFMKREFGESLLADMSTDLRLKTSLLENLSKPNILDRQQLSLSKHNLLSGKYSIDSLFEVYKYDYLGDVSISEVTMDDKAFIYCEATDPLHYRGIGHFFLLQQVDGEWTILETFSGWELSTDTTDFLQ
ncbi:hypothetical protein [uncultured Imperialibacter sp.]|uniref:hypothetical protein n=1 Tax=uncultured Imperialibacter sp. TaxID=1672639 RepID=UPI0030D94167